MGGGATTETHLQRLNLLSDAVVRWHLGRVKTRQTDTKPQQTTRAGGQGSGRAETCTLEETETNMTENKNVDRSRDSLPLHSSDKAQQTWIR